MDYQAVISGGGEKIHLPIEADDDNQAYAKAATYAEQTFPRLLRQHINVTRLKDGEQAIDDRTELKFVLPHMGRPSQGRTKRVQAFVTPEVFGWLEAQKQLGETISDVVFRLFKEQGNG